jgi:defect-in-organelle-trafficking protein DotB
VNASGCKDGTGGGASIVMRSIPSLPPKIEDLGIEPEIMEAATPNNGLVLVTGVMGTGKSTLLSSVLRYIRENQPRNILTYEAPVEFDLMGIPNPCGPLAQASIPEHLTNFNRAAPNSARRAADVVLIGESRDVETLRGMIEMAEIGVAAYSTVHTRGVAETPTRIINVFPADMQNQIASTLLASLRLIVQQRLLSSTKGGRIALREFLVFDAAIRQELFGIPVNGLIPAIQAMVESRGRTILQDAEEKYSQGLIYKEDYEAIRHEQEMKKEDVLNVA